MRLNGLRFADQAAQGRAARRARPRSTSCLRAELEVELGEFALEMQGSAGLRARRGRRRSTAVAGRRFALTWPEVVIGGGTPNIQKNIIAERILRLPKD